MKNSFYPEQELRRRCLCWAVKLRVNPKVIRIQKMSKKWGSCSSTGIITLAEDLVEKDKGFQDFVIVHELLHLRYPTHGRLFKASMSAHIPYWRELGVDNTADSEGSYKVCEGQRRYIYRSDKAVETVNR